MIIYLVIHLYIMIIKVYSFIILFSITVLLYDFPSLVAILVAA